MTDEHEPAPRPMLASDAERDHSIALLREAVGEGRLTLEEFSGRVELVQTARTDQDLVRLTADLPTTATTSAAGSVTTPTNAHRAFCSHLTRSGPWSLPRHSAWRSIFGTIDLDLREARLDAPDTVIEVYNLFGTVTVIVPEGIEVAVTGGGLFASQKITAPERPPAPGGPTLTIQASGPGGTLYVRNRPGLKQSIKDALGR